MSGFLRQATARYIKVGPFLDILDGATLKTGLTVTGGQILISKDGGAIASIHNFTGLLEDSNGVYGAMLDDTDTATLKILKLFINKATCLPYFDDFTVLTTGVYDALFGADPPAAGATLLLGVTGILNSIIGVPTGVWGNVNRALTDKVLFGVTGLPVLADVVTGVWGGTSRALTDKTVFGVTGLPVLTDIVTGVWGGASRTLTDKAGYSTTGVNGAEIGALATGVWGATTRSLTDKVIFGVTGLPVLADIVTGVWGGTSRSLTDKVIFGVTGIPVLADMVTGIWGGISRTLTDKASYSTTGISSGAAVGDLATGIWGASSRTLTDKASYSTTGLPNLADIATGVWGSPNSQIPALRDTLILGITGVGAIVTTKAEGATMLLGITGIRNDIILMQTTVLLTISGISSGGGAGITGYATQDMLITGINEIMAGLTGVGAMASTKAEGATMLLGITGILNNIRYPVIRK